MSAGNQWFPLFVGDYLADTGHLTTEEHGAYLLLLMHQWRTGLIPAASDEQARIVRLSGRRWVKLSPTVLAFFSRAEGGFQQMRLERARGEKDKKAQQLSDAARKAGLASAAQRSLNDRPTVTPTVTPTVDQRSSTYLYRDTEKKEEITPSPSKNEGEGEGNAAIAASPAIADLPAEEAATIARAAPWPAEPVLRALAAIWNELAADHGLSQVSELNEARRTSLRARCKERWTKDPEKKFRAYVARIVTSPFLLGQEGGGGRSWKADFDWAIRPSSVLRVAEGKYHDGEAG